MTPARIEEFITHSYACQTAFSIESTFNGHERFLYALLRTIQPDTYVELGSFTGCSTKTACEALTDNGSGQVFALDAWVGDIHMGRFKRNVFEQFQENTQGHDNLNIVKGWFADSASQFEDDSIDIILIDGQHDYENVKTDFETWLPKTKAGGIMLFHDSAEKQPDFGVDQLISELSAEYDIFEFFHSHGLAVLQKPFIDQPDEPGLVAAIKNNSLFRSHFENTAKIHSLEVRIANMGRVVKRTFPYGVYKLLGMHRRI